MFLKNPLIFAVIAMVAMNTTGCLVSIEYKDEVATQSREDDLNTEEGSLQRAEKTTREFAAKLLTQSFSEITELLNLPPGYFISDSDAQYFLERSSLAELIGTGEEISNIELDGSAVEKTAEFTVGKKKYSINLVLSDDSAWKVDVPSMFVENWSIKVPGDCTVTVDDQDVSSYKMTMQNIDAAYALYTFPAISTGSHTLVVSSSLYGSFTQNITPKKTSDTYTMVCKISDQETSNILSCVKTIWNGLYSDYKSGADVPSIRKYFTSTVDTNILTNILTSYFPSLEGEKSNTNYSGFYVTDVIPWTTDNYGAAVLETNNSVTVNFGYRLEFVDDQGEYHNCNKATSLVMAYEDGTYKIKTIPDTTLFTDNDYTNNDY